MNLSEVLKKSLVAQNVKSNVLKVSYFPVYSLYEFDPERYKNLWYNLYSGDLHESFANLKVQYIQEVMCCMDKSFNFINCPNSNSQFTYPNIPVRMCQPNVPIAYPKISHL